MIASAPRNWARLWTVSTPTSSATPASPVTSPSAWVRSIDSLRSRNGAKRPTNSDAGDTSTAVSPLGTSRSPKVISRNGAAIAVTPSRSAAPGRRAPARRDAHDAPPWTRTKATSTTAASAERRNTISRPCVS